MSKKGRQLRQIKKQEKQIRKLEKRLKQKGISLTESSQEVESTEYKPKALSEVRQQKKKLEKIMQGRPVQTVEERPVEKKFKLTEKQLQKAIQSRRQRQKPTRTKTKVNNAPIKASKKQLDKAIEARKNKLRQQIEQSRKKQLEEIEDTGAPEIPTADVPEVNPPSVTPSGEQHERTDSTNTDPSFFAKVVISNYLWECQKFPNSAYPVIKDWIERLINSRGEESVAQMLQDGAEAGLVLTYDIAYSEKLYGYLADMLNYLPDSTDWEKEEIMEQFESWEDIL